MSWPPKSHRVQGLVFGLGVGVVITVMLGALGEFGWLPGLLTGACVGLVGGIYFANAMREPDDGQDGADEQAAERPPADDTVVIDTKRWEFYALTVVPLLTVPTLFAAQSLPLTLSVLFLLALVSPILLRRLKSKRPPRS